MAVDSNVVVSSDIEADKNTPKDPEKAGEEGKKSDEKPPKPESVPLSKLFSLASWFDMGLFVVGCLGALVNGGQNPGFVYAWGRMIDAVGGTSDTKMSDQLLLMSMIGVGTFIASSFQGLCLRSFALRQSMKMRTKYYEAILSKDIAWFDARTPAALPQELNDDAERVAEALADKLGQGIAGSSGFMLSIILSFVLGWQLALATLVAVPLMAIGMVFFGKAVQEVAQESQSWYSSAGAIVEETLFAIRTVVALGDEKRWINKYTDAVNSAKLAARRNEFKIAAGMGWTEAVFALATAGALYLGMILIYNDELNGSTGRIWTGGDILIVFFMLLTGGFLIGQTEPMAKALNEGRVAMARFNKVLKAKNEIQATGDGKDTRKQVQNFESFEFKDVKFTYPTRPEQPVLRGVSFKIDRGQKVAFVGESGSGKSTVMSLLERFYDPTEGAVLLNGEDLRTFAPASLRSIIGYVGQEPVLFATTIRENILQGKPGASEAELRHACKVANLAFVDALPLKLETFVGTGGSQFSGGQKQRIAIARAVLRNPKVLFLDEATSALDAESESMIQETFDTISREGVDGQPLTTVAIAHRLRTIRNSDTIYVLKAGEIAEKGTHDVLAAKNGGIYQALAATQAMRAATGIVSEDENKIATGPTVENIAKAQEKVADDLVPRTSVEKLGGEKVKKEKVKMSRLLQFNKPEWGFYIPGILGSMGHGAGTPMQGFLTVAVLDSFYGPKDTMKDDVTMTVIYFCLTAFGMFVSTMLQFGCFGILGEAMTARLRVALFSHIFRQEVGFHDDPDHTPALIGGALQLWAYRVKNLNAATAAIAEVLGSLTCGLVGAFIGSWQMTLAMLGAIPVLAAAMAIQFAFMLGGTNMGNENMKVAQQVVSDSVQNARTVHAIGNTQSLVKTYDLRVQQANEGYVKKALISGMAFGFGMAAPPLVMTFGFWYSDKLMQNGEATFKGVMMAFMGILYAGIAAGQAMGKVGDMKKAKDAYKGIFAVLDRESKIDGLDPKGSIPAWAAQNRSAVGQIEFEGVRFAYPFRSELEVLKGVNFQIASGSSVGLVGPSGGGKSTILALLQRFYDPSKGSVFVGQAKMDLSEIDIRWWRKQIGYVGQEPILFNTTIKENIMYSLDSEGSANQLSDQRYEECKKMARVDFKDDIEVGPRGSKLSGGQKQRVAICRALVRDPPILLFDEATSALDSESEKIVQEALDAVSVGRTSITIAHRLSTIQHSSKILVAAEGVIMESGTHDELINLKGIYYKLWSGNDSKSS